MFVSEPFHGLAIVNVNVKLLTFLECLVELKNRRIYKKG